MTFFSETLLVRNRPLGMLFGQIPDFKLDLHIELGQSGSSGPSIIDYTNRNSQS